MKKLLEEDENTILKIKELYLENNMTTAQVAKEFGCSTAVVQRFLKKHSIRKVEGFFPNKEQQQYIKEAVNNKITYKEIAETLNVNCWNITRYINREILHKGKYSNVLCKTSWYKNRTALFWYFAGLFTSDGHLGKFNELRIFQKARKYLKNIQLFIGHKGLLYGKSSTCFILSICDEQLHKIFEEAGFTEDKRYTAPFMKANTIENQWIYLRGIFDGDGSFYYKFVSGRFEGSNWEICSGSKSLVTTLKSFLRSQSINSNIEICKSTVNNNYYRLTVRNQKDLKKLFKNLYKTNTKYKLDVKYKKFKLYIKILEEKSKLKI